MIERVNFNRRTDRPCVRRIKVGSSSAEGDGTGAQAGLGLAGRVDRPDDGRHQGDRAADAVGAAAEDGPERFDGRGARRRESGVGRDGDGGDERCVAEVGGRQDAGSYSGQHREKRGRAEPAVRQEAVRHSHHQYRG